MGFINKYLCEPGGSLCASLCAALVDMGFGLKSHLTLGSRSPWKCSKLYFKRYNMKININKFQGQTLIFQTWCGKTIILFYCFWLLLFENFCLLHDIQKRSLINITRCQESKVMLFSSYIWSLGQCTSELCSDKKFDPHGTQEGHLRG